MSKQHEQLLAKEGFIIVDKGPLNWSRRAAFQKLVDVGLAKVSRHNSYVVYTWIGATAPSPEGAADGAR